jgi:WD40 repeat protein
VLAIQALNNGDLASGSDDGTMKLWDVENGTVKKDKYVNSAITSFLLLENGDLVSGSADGSVIIWQN